MVASAIYYSEIITKMKSKLVYRLDHINRLIAGHIEMCSVG